jgi:hypothetical protein
MNLQPIPYGDIDEMAIRIIELEANKTKLFDAQNKVTNISTSYTAESILPKWINLINAIIEL